MSSKPKEGPPAGPPPEKKGPSGPVITPQILGIVFGVILLVGVIAYYQFVTVKYRNELERLNSSVNQTKTQIDTYRKKGAKKDKADEVNKTLKAKLGSLGYLFLEDQNSIIPFWESTFLPMLETSTLSIGPNTVIEVEEYRFFINMAMNPFQSLPQTPLIENLAKSFPIEYQGERDGQPADGPLDTTPNRFLMPYTIKVEGLVGTYENAMTFVAKVQRTRTREFITVHCIKNDEKESVGLFRTTTEWALVFTVYFMNPEAQANSPDPPGLPKSEKC